MSGDRCRKMEGQSEPGPAPRSTGASGGKEAMTYRERERETIRRLREELEKRQSREQRGLIAHPTAGSYDVKPDDQAEVLFELICL